MYKALMKHDNYSVEWMGLLEKKRESVSCYGMRYHAKKVYRVPYCPKKKRGCSSCIIKRAHLQVPGHGDGLTDHSVKNPHPTRDQKRITHTHNT